MQLRILLLIFSLLLLALLLYYSDFFKVVSLLAKANIFYVSLGFCLWFFGLVIRTERWRYLLSKAKIKLGFWQSAKVYIQGMFLSNVTPAKVGDPLRSVLLKAACKKSISSSLPSVFVERIFDVVVTVLFSLLGLFFFYSLSLWLAGAVAVYTAVFGVAVYVLISERRTRKFFGKLSFLFKFAKLEKKIENFSRNLHKAFMKYKNRRTLFVAFVYSALVWLIEGLILWVSFLSIGISISIAFSVTIVAFTTLIAVLTFLPGGLGSSEAVSVLVFTKLFNLSIAEVMSAAILSRLFGYWVYVLFGAVLLASSTYKGKI
jgi:uncharacterized protein (TIRG00374 family)